MNFLFFFFSLGSLESRSEKEQNLATDHDVEIGCCRIIVIKSLDGDHLFERCKSSKEKGLFTSDGDLSLIRC